MGVRPQLNLRYTATRLSTAAEMSSRSTSDCMSSAFESSTKKELFTTEAMISMEVDVGKYNHVAVRTTEE